MVKPRENLDVEALQGYAHAFASYWLMGRHPARSLYALGREGLKREIYNLYYADEFEFLIDAIRGELGGTGRESFDTMIDNLRTSQPRDEDVFKRLLSENLAVDAKGNHIGGRTGKADHGRRVVGVTYAPCETLESIRRRKRRGLPLHVPGRTDREVVQKLKRVRWPIYAGEEIERAAIEAGERKFVQEGLDIIDPLPMPDMVMATAPSISTEAAIAAADAIVDLLDEGSTAAEIRGRTGSQPADVESSETGTLLFTCPMSDPAFNAAGDGAPGGTASADTITDDSSADNTGTLTYCRLAATGTGADDHIDGSAGTSDADIIFNTVSIAAGGVVSFSSYDVTVPET